MSFGPNLPDISAGRFDEEKSRLKNRPPAKIRQRMEQTRALEL